MVPGLHGGALRLCRRPRHLRGRALRPRCGAAPAPQGGAIDLRSLAGRLRAAGDVTANEYLVRFRAAGAELVVFGDGRAIVKGVRDAAEARGVYARYVGN